MASDLQRKDLRQIMKVAWLEKRSVVLHHLDRISCKFLSLHGYINERHAIPGKHSIYLHVLTAQPLKDSNGFTSVSYHFLFLSSHTNLSQSFSEVFLLAKKPNDDNHSAGDLFR